MQEKGEGKNGKGRERYMEIKSIKRREKKGRDNDDGGGGTREGE